MTKMQRAVRRASDSEKDAEFPEDTDRVAKETPSSGWMPNRLDGTEWSGGHRAGKCRVTILLFLAVSFIGLMANTGYSNQPRTVE